MSKVLRFDRDSGKLVMTATVAAPFRVLTPEIVARIRQVVEQYDASTRERIRRAVLKAIDNELAAIKAERESKA